MTDRPRALAVLIAVFLLGCILGSAGSYFWLRRPLALPIRNGENGPRPMPERQRLSDLLQLSPDQEARYREIMAESRKELNALRIEQTPKIETIRSETNSKFLAILNQEQQEKFAAFLKEMENRRTRAPRTRGFEPSR